MSKKMIAFLTAAAASLSMGSLVSAEVTVNEDKTILTVDCGGEDLITSEVNNEIFGGDAVTGLQALIESGAVTVNGTPINSGDVSVNGALALWENEDDTWSWNAHFYAAHEENIGYEEACIDFVEGMSKLSGLTYTLTLEGGQATAVDFLVQDVCVAKDIERGDDYTTVSVYGPGDGSMNRTDPSTIEFANELVEPDSDGVLPEGSCGIIYWLDEKGWHLKRCDSQQVAATADYEWNGTQINLEYSQPWNRPSQPLAALGMIGIEPIEMTEWFINGLTCGWSYTDAKADLTEAIAKAEAALEEIPVAEDENDFSEGEPWVTQEYYDAFADLVENTKEIAEKDNMDPMDYAAAYYRLSVSYGGDGGFHASAANIYSNGIGFMTYAYDKEGDKS